MLRGRQGLQVLGIVGPIGGLKQAKHASADVTTNMQLCWRNTGISLRVVALLLATHLSKDADPGECTWRGLRQDDRALQKGGRGLLSQRCHARDTLPHLRHNSCAILLACMHTKNTLCPMATCRFWRAALGNHTWETEGGFTTADDSVVHLHCEVTGLQVFKRSQCPAIQAYDLDILRQGCRSPGQATRLCALWSQRWQTSRLLPVLGRKAAEAEGGSPSSSRPDRDCCRGSPLLLTRYVLGSSRDFSRSVCCTSQEVYCQASTTGCRPS